MTPCRACQVPYEPSPHEIRKRDYMCGSCRSNWHKAYRQRRKAEGISTSGTRMPRDYHLDYDAGYSKRADVRVRRAESAKIRRNNPAERLRYEARDLVRRAVASKKLFRQPCELCGCERTQAHHDDYGQPLAVRWLCIPHHREFHAKAKGGEA